MHHVPGMIYLVLQRLTKNDITKKCVEKNEMKKQNRKIKRKSLTFLRRQERRSQGTRAATRLPAPWFPSPAASQSPHKGSEESPAAYKTTNQNQNQN